MRDAEERIKTEREGVDLRESSTPLHASEEGGDEDCIESVVSEAAELRGGSQYVAPLMPCTFGKTYHHGDVR
jgi:hypothetical protein